MIFTQLLNGQYTDSENYFIIAGLVFFLNYPENSVHLPIVDISGLLCTSQVFEGIESQDYDDAILNLSHHTRAILSFRNVMICCGSCNHRESVFVKFACFFCLFIFQDLIQFYQDSFPEGQTQSHFLYRYSLRIY